MTLSPFFAHFINHIKSDIIKLSSGNAGQEWLNRDINVRLYVQEVPSAIRFSFQPDLYFTARHVKTQTTETAYCFLLFRGSNEVAQALIYLTQVHKNEWISPIKAPFGGIQCDEHCSTEALLFLIQCVSDFVHQHGGKAIEIKTRPDFYHQTIHKKLAECYTRSGFSQAEILTNHYVPVTEILFEKILVPAEKRRLRKCREAGFESLCDLSPDVDFVHNFITASRNCLGYTLSMNRVQMRDLITKFPNDVYLFMILDRAEIVALTVVVKVNRNVAYNFLSADLLSYREYSPSVMLTEAVYHFCQQNGISMLDLGTSTDHQGREKENLIRFKKNIGGVPGSKTKYKKLLTG